MVLCAEVEIRERVEPVERRVSWQPLLNQLERAATDGAFRERLAMSVGADGVRLSAAELKLLLGLPDASDEELIEVLQIRLSKTRGASCGCGG
jgi:hypothetical protein